MPSLKSFHLGSSVPASRNKCLNVHLHLFWEKAGMQLQQMASRAPQKHRMKHSRVSHRLAWSRIDADDIEPRPKSESHSASSTTPIRTDAFAPTGGYVHADLHLHIHVLGKKAAPFMMVLTDAHFQLALGEATSESCVIVARCMM